MGAGNPHTKSGSTSRQMKPSDPKHEDSTGCHLGSATRLIRRYGDLVAIPRHIKATGYKRKGAYGFTPVMSSETTYVAVQKKVLFITKTKRLEPYRPDAPRNRPKESMTNIVGSRYKMHPCITCEKYRGSSVIKLRDGDIDSLKPWKTMNQVFDECTEVKDTIGLSNPGISSDIAKYVHKKQGMYNV